MSNSNTTIERLFLNTLAFQFPAEPVVFYFSDTNNPDAHYTFLKSSTLFPVGIHELFPNLNNNDTLYTSFTKPVKGAKPLAIDFNNLDNFHLVKRYYNEQIQLFFAQKNLLADKTFIGDTQIWINDKKSKNKKFSTFDRFTLKINYNSFLQTPELVVSYDRQAKVLKQSVAQFISSFSATADDIFDASFNPDNPAEIINKVIVVKYLDKDKKRINLKLRRYSKLCEQSDNGEPINYDNIYPVVNNQLAYSLNLTIDEPDNEYPTKKNRYKTYIPKITGFRDMFLLNDDFRRIVPVESDFTPIEAGKVKNERRFPTFIQSFTNILFLASMKKATVEST